MIAVIGQLKTDILQGWGKYDKKTLHTVCYSKVTEIISWDQDCAHISEEVLLQAKFHLI